MLTINKKYIYLFVPTNFRKGFFDKTFTGKQMWCVTSNIFILYNEQCFAQIEN